MLRTLARAAGDQAGFTLAAVIVILTVISIMIAMTIPEQWSMVMKREREKQTIWEMKQFARAIYTFNQKHGALPTSMDQLQKAREPRVLRGVKPWPCPLTGSDKDWILVPPAAVTGAPAAGSISGGMPGDNTQTGTQGTQTGTGGNQTGTGGNQGGNGGRGGRGGRGGGGSQSGGNPTEGNVGFGGPNQPAQAKGPSRLNKDASPKDYVGPFIGIRPNARGKSIIALNGAENYEEWVYTSTDVLNEMKANAASFMIR